MASVQIEGLADLEAALGELPASTAKAVLRRIGIEALEPFDAAWRADAPRLTGTLAESGGVGTKLSRRQKALQAQERDSLVEVYAGPGPDPAAVQEEFGNEHQAPHPFVRPAWDATKDEVLDRTISLLNTEIEKTVSRRKARAEAVANRILSGR